MSDLDGCWAVWADSAAWRLALGRGAAAPAAPAAGPVAVPGKNGRAVAVLAAEGLLSKQSWYGTSTVRLRGEIAAAAGDPAVSGILIRISSPGGTVAGMTELADAVRAARRQKPVWAAIEDLGASAAYWLASQADMAFATSPTALVGSIGTILTVYDLSAAAEREGVRAVVFSTGPLKGAGVPGTPLTDDHRAYFQRIVDDAQAAFDAAVRAGRGLTAAQLAAAKTGGVFSAPEAVSLKLIDGVRSLDQTLKALANAK